MNPSPFIVGFAGTELDKSLRRHLLKMRPAGIVLFQRNIQSLSQTRRLVNELRDLLGEIIVSVDHEGGLVSRFPADCPVPPSPRALRESGSEETIRAACRIQAEVLAYLGVNLNFAPVLDLGVDVDNRVIGTRSFSGNPDQVATYGRICLEEHERMGIGTTLKHFPGHGRTAVDSHFQSGRVEHSDRLSIESDLLPFRRCVAGGAPAVMTAHLLYPKLDETRVASLSRVILRELLRDQVRFEGLVITDCVEMAGLAQTRSPEHLAELGLEAGVDLFISSFSLKKSYQFQLELKRGFDRWVSATGFDWEEGPTYVTRTNRFLRKYGHGEPLDTLPDRWRETLDIHASTLVRLRAHPIKEGYSTLYLVELSTGANRGINADVSWNPVSRELLRGRANVVGGTVLTGVDRVALAAAVRECNTNRRTCVLLTRDGFRSEGYLSFLSELREADSAIHVALLDSRDLMGSCPNEWVTWGYNAFTGKMLAEQIDLMTRHTAS